MYLSIVLLADLTKCEGGDGERGLAPLAQFVDEHEGDQSGILHFLDNEKSEDGNDDYDDTPEPRWRY